MHLRKILLALSLSTTIFAQTGPNVASKIVESTNAFGIDLTKPMTHDEANSVYSPFSLFTCLSMVATGAEGSTYIAMKKTLHWPGNAPGVAKAVNGLAKQLFVPSSSKDCPLTFSNANALFAEMDTTFLPAFQKIVEEDYTADLQSIDFSQSTQAVDTINTWVANSTNDKIKRLLDTGDIDASTRLALVNAIYFSGQWRTPFAKEKTSKQIFHVDEKIHHIVDMMRLVGTFRYLDQAPLQVLSLPFKACDTTGPHTSLIVVLPSTLEDFNDLQRNLINSQVQGWLKGLSPASVDVQLPRFCLRNRYDMEAALRKLGMGEAFSRRANFSKIDGSTDLFLSKVIHEAYFDLNENGVEAAAATAASINVTSAALPKPSPISFVANRAFLFLLVDEDTGTILFMGKFTDPSLARCE